MPSNKQAKKAKAITTAKAGVKPAPADKVKRVAIVREHHDINPSYNGLSLSYNRSKSRTRIHIESFNTQPGTSLTQRGNAFLHDLKAKYAGAVFKRLDLDAGNLNRSIRAGLVKHVAGDPVSDQCTFQLTDKALATKFI